MDDVQNPGVQAHAASTVLNFSENCTPEVLAPYLDGIVNKLLVLLQNGKQLVQEGALTALASMADSSQVMEVLTFLHGSQLESDDLATSYMLQVKFLAEINKDILPYVGVVMLPLLQFTQLKPDATIRSADSDNDIEKSDDESMETITLGGKSVWIKTSVLEEKATACNMLCSYVDELKEACFKVFIFSIVMLVD